MPHGSMPPTRAVQMTRSNAHSTAIPGFEGPTPQAIEYKFRRHLGAVNPYLALTDAALVDFSRSVMKQPNPETHLSRRMREIGQNRLHLKTEDIGKARRFVHLSGIEHVNSCGDFLCKQLRQHPQVKRARATIDPDTQKLKGGFLLSTLYLLILTLRRSPPPNPPSRREIEQILDPLVFSLLDYFRLVRNFSLHSDPRDEQTAVSIYENGVDHSKIKAEYGASLNLPTGIGRSDFIICSKAWQRAARSLCGSVAERENVLPELLRQRYKNCRDASRRRTGALAVLEQRFLLDRKDADTVLEILGW